MSEQKVHELWMITEISKDKYQELCVGYYHDYKDLWDHYKALSKNRDERTLLIQKQKWNIEGFFTIGANWNNLDDHTSFDHRENSTGKSNLGVRREVVGKIPFGEPDSIPHRIK